VEDNDMMSDESDTEMLSQMDDNTFNKLIEEAKVLDF
jgi:hypothetical protein